MWCVAMRTVWPVCSRTAGWRRQSMTVAGLAAPHSTLPAYRTGTPTSRPPAAQPCSAFFYERGPSYRQCTKEANKQSSGKEMIQLLAVCCAWVLLSHFVCWLSDEGRRAARQACGAFLSLPPPPPSSSLQKVEDAHFQTPRVLPMAPVIACCACGPHAQACLGWGGWR